jgi:ABC-type lipoprotein release transport system permease subunit
MILEGRRADPSRPHELVLPDAVARRVHKGVGDEMRFVSVAPEDADSIESDKPKANGPRFTLRIVGISRGPSDLVARDSDNFHFIYLTPAWFKMYGDQVVELDRSVMIRLRRGPDDFGAWSRAVNPTGDPDARPTWLFSPAAVEDSVSTIVDGLRLFALIAGIGGIVAVLQAVERHVGASATDLELLRMLGVPRRGRAAASVFALLPGLVSGVIGAVAVAFAMSWFMPIGLARRAEPARGWSFDGLVLIGGALAILVVVLGIAAAVAWRAAAHQSDRVARSSSSWNARRLVGLPPVVATGLRLATRRGKGNEFVPVRSAITGVAVAIAGVIAVSVFGAGLTHLVDEPDRYGVSWDATVFHGNNQSAAGDRARLRKIPEVDDIAVVHAQLQGLLDGQYSGDGFAIERQRGRIAPVTRAGRAPSTDDEIALGADTADRLGVRTGDRVRLTGSGGSRSMRVVGEALAPTVDDPALLASGFLVTPATVTALKLDRGDAFSRFAVTFDQGISAREGRQALEAAGFSVTTPAPPPEVARLRDVQSLPFALAGILALIGAVVVVLALVITVRRRRRDLALLQVLGFTRSQVTGSVIGQAGVFATIGLLVGVPLGLLLGKFVWEHIAGAIGVATDPSIPVVAIVLTAVGVVIVAVVAALVPAANAARLRPAEILHQG